MLNYMDIQEVISKYYNPKDKLSEMFWRLYKDPRVQEVATWGKVEDNKDPDGYGRLKVRAPLVFADAVSPWIPMVRPWASKKYGIWTLPDIGDAVIIGFSLRDPSKPFVMGCMPTRRTLPYLEKNPNNDQKYIRTKSGLEVIMNDKDGEEQLVVSAKDGKLLILIHKGGIQIKNELGDITLKAKKVNVESENMLLKSKKDTSINVSDGPLNLKAGKALAQKAGGNVTYKGKKIKLKGSMGVTAGGKQIAKKDDMVVGVDTHDVQIPTNSGMQTIPMIPHPYIGKLVDKLSTDVTVNDKPAAVKGSKSKNSPSHMPIGGVKFKKNPNNEGEVSSGTCPKVKINGKEAAVLGAKVKTCSDPQPKESCSIIAIGASAPIPIMPPGFDPEQYKRDGGFMMNLREPVAKPGQPNSLTDERSLSSPKWSSNKVNVGEEVSLSVNVESQQGLRGAVVFKIYPEGADPEKDPPVATKAVRKEKGTAEVKWPPQQPDKQAEETERKFFFVAWAFGCKKVKSGNLTAEKEMPEFSELKWELVEHDEEGKETSREEVDKVEHGKTVALCAKVKKLEDGEKATIFVYEEGYSDPDDFRARRLVEVKDGMVQTEWQVREKKKRLSELTENDEIKYVFAIEPANCKNIRSENSAPLKLTFVMIVEFLYSNNEYQSNNEYILKNESGSYKKTLKTQDDKIPNDDRITLKFEEILPGSEYTLIIKNNDGNEEIEYFKQYPFQDIIEG